MVMSRDQNAGQNGYIQIGYESFETVCFINSQPPNSTHLGSIRVNNTETP
jgi:hypothetical protein